MTRLLGLVVIYAVMILAWTTAGLFLLLAPARAGNLINESFGLFPEVRSNDFGKKMALRLVGAGLLVFAFHFVLRVAALLGGKS